MGVGAIFHKELSDNVSGRRFPILFALIFLTGLSSAYLGARSLADISIPEPEQPLAFLYLFTGSPEPAPSFIYFISLFGPIIGIALGFDAINRELSSGSLVTLLSNPIYRDSVINGKFLAGFATIITILGSTVGLIVGLDILMLGFGPSLEAAVRILYFLFVAIIFVTFWMNLGLLCSVIFRRIATSALVCIALWTFFSFFIYMVADVVASVAVPLRGAPFYVPAEALIKHTELKALIARLSPSVLFVEATMIILNPNIRGLGPLYVVDPELPMPAPLGLEASIWIAWPHIAALLAATAICFLISYLAFLRLEVKPGWAG